MALVYFPVCGTTQGPPDTSGDATLQTATTLASTYTATTNHVLAKGYSEVVFKFVYTKGDETTLQIRPEGSSDGGTTWYPLAYKAPQATGVSELTADIMQITGTLTVASPPMDRLGHALVRCSVKATGGTPTGTLAVYASASVSTVRT